MSEVAARTSCLRHRAKIRFFVFYDDLQDIAKGKHADKVNAFLRVLEVRTNDRITEHEGAAKDCKNKNQPEPIFNPWLELTYKDFEWYSLGLFKRSSFQVADKEAEKMLFCKSRLGKRPRNPENPESSLMDYKEYILVIENVQAALDGVELPITGEYLEKYGTDEYVPPVKNNSTHTNKTAPPVFSNSDPVLNKTAPPVENNRNLSNSNYLDNNNKEDTYSRDFASAQHDAPTPLSLQAKIADLQQQLAALQQQASFEFSTPVVETPVPNVENVEPTRQPLEQTESSKQPPIVNVTTHAETVPEGVPAQEKPARAARQRKPKVEDETIKARVEKVFDYFDVLLQETTGNPKATYNRTKRAFAEIRDNILPCNPPASEKRLRKVYTALWNTPRDARSGFEWKKNMTIKAVCGQYESRMIAFDAEEKQEEEKNRKPSPGEVKTIIQAASTMSSYKPLQLHPRQQRKAQ